jgi:hypothetical protein
VSDVALLQQQGWTARVTAQAPSRAGPDYAEFVCVWARSGSRDPTKPLDFRPRVERTPGDFLDEDNMLPLLKLLSRHPGAPMAFAQMCSVPSGFLRIRALLEYLKRQADEPNVTNASDQGSTTAYVSPLLVNEVMASYQLNDDLAQEEVARLRGEARARVMRDMLEIAAKASEDAFQIAAHTWFRKEYSRRQAAETNKALAAGTASGGRGSAGGSQGGRLPDSASVRAVDVASNAPSESSAGRAQAAETAAIPLNLGFGRRPAS